MAATCVFCRKCAQFLVFCVVLTVASARDDSALLQQLQHHTNIELGYDFFNVTKALNINAVDMNVSASCIYQLNGVANAVKQNELWALQMTDAWAKIPSGILYGHLMELGNFDECLSVAAELSAEQSIQGKYCLANVALEGPNSAKLQLGICIPKACAAAELTVLFTQFLQTTLNVNFGNTSVVVLNNDDSCTTRERVVLEPLDWVTVSVLILLAALMACSTFYDYLYTYNGKTLHKLLAAFSIRKNLRHLMKIQHGHIPCLHGIRCISLFWIIFSHCYIYRLVAPNINSIQILKWEQTVFSMFIQNGFFAVDTFFFLSGLLLVMVIFRELEKNSGKLNVPMMYIHRYLRLTPVVALALLIFMTLFRYVSNGPIWNMFMAQTKHCRNTWWATLLYVQNYAAPQKMCLAHAWYLAVDTQLYVLSPIFLLIMWKWSRKGIAAIVSFGLLMVACLFSIIMIYHYTIFDLPRNYGAMIKIYFSTHTRTSPWIIGLIFGYYLHRNNGRIVKLPTWLVLAGWTISLTLLLTIIFVWYPKAGSNDLTSLESAFYLALGRAAWPLALCWIVFACLNGYGGHINVFLSWNFWQPISKLSYCMYIWHLLVITVNIARTKTNTYFSDYDVILDFWHSFGVTLLVSICMYLAIEAPLFDIEKFLLQRNKPNPEKVASTPTTSISQQNLCD